LNSFLFRGTESFFNPEEAHKNEFGEKAYKNLCQVKATAQRTNCKKIVLTYSLPP